MRHDFHPHLCATLSGDVIDRVFGDALAGDVTAATNAIEQKRVVFFAFLERRAA
ncbi:hypothetical protein D3C76_1544160 [compost metagenome]